MSKTKHWHSWEKTTASILQPEEFVTNSKLWTLCPLPAFRIKDQWAKMTSCWKKKGCRGWKLKKRSYASLWQNTSPWIHQHSEVLCQQQRRGSFKNKHVDFHPKLVSHWHVVYFWAANQLSLTFFLVCVCGRFLFISFVDRKCVKNPTFLETIHDWTLRLNLLWCALILRSFWLKMSRVLPPDFDYKNNRTKVNQTKFFIYS